MTLVGNQADNRSGGSAISVNTPAIRYNEGNSWNPALYYQAAASGLPAGPNAVGDRIIHTDPTSGGFVGKVCTTGGSPGTWKTFGAIS